MKGHVAEYSDDAKTGIIQGDDGNQYQFAEGDWKADGIPAAGTEVDFSTHEFHARSIYLRSARTAPSGGFGYFLECFRKYADFGGRARRREYWYFTLFTELFAVGIFAIDYAADSLPLLYVIYWIGILLPTWAVIVRRLHDVGKSGWFMLIVIIPIIGPIWLFILSVKDSDRGMNQYGPNPKEAVV